MRFLQSLVFFIISTSFCTLHGQYLWGKQSVGDNAISGNNLASDADGNVYVVGEMDGTVDFDGVVLGDVGGNSFMHGYVAKYDSEGIVQWVRPVKGNSNNEMPGVAVGSDGAVYVCGSYSHTNDLTILDFGNIQLEGNRSCSGYVAKIDPEGNWQWAKRMLATTNTVNQEMEPNEIVVTSENEIIVGGTFNGPVLVDSVLYNDVGNTNNDKIFFCKFTAGGDILWFRHGEGDWGNQCITVICPVGGMEMVIDGEDNYYLLAHTNGASYGTDTLLEDFGTGFAVVSFDSDGDLRWWETVTSSSGGGILGGIAIDDQDNIYVGAQKSGFLHIGSDTILDDLSTTLWLFKFSPQGEFLYGKNTHDDYNGFGQALLYDLVFLPQGYIAAVGGYEPGFNQSGPVFFGDTIGGSGERACFIAAYNKDGEYQSVADISYPDGNFGGEFLPRRLALYENGMVNMTGRFDENITIGDITYTSDNLKEMFIMQVDILGLLDLTTSIVKVPGRETLQIFPNPASDVIRLLGDKTINHVSILTLDGLEVQRFTGLLNQDAQVELSGIPPGTYLVRTQAGEIGKLVVVH